MNLSVQNMELHTSSHPPIRRHLTTYYFQSTYPAS